MEREEDVMRQFEFLLGDWSLEYKVPKSKHSEEMTGTGYGTFERTLNDKYVFFNYSFFVEGPEGQAHAVFAWDSKAKLYRFWWFESSGNFDMATCNFINEDTLFLNWHDSLLSQTFQKIGPDQIVLKMKEPDAEGKHTPILEVLFTRK